MFHRTKLTDTSCPLKGIPRQSWILDSMPWIPESRYLIPVFVSRTWILHSLGCISDSKAKDSRFHRQKYPGFQIPLPKISQILESGFLRWGTFLKHENLAFSLWYPYSANIFDGYSLISFFFNVELHQSHEAVCWWTSVDASQQAVWWPSITCAIC